ncbi:uncharacterized protein DMAD_07829 [Drosophila madeirensis]|uniref:Uncharacterized protein n=1 Tax=Drosophila madeirensis TaxID=30013 RepID=A0AAU9EX03_DROMD
MEPDTTAPTFDGAGWLKGVKILKYKDDPTLRWLTRMVCQLEALEEGPKLQVLFPIPFQGHRALNLLQRQTLEVPTTDWKDLHIGSPRPKEGSMFYIPDEQEGGGPSIPEIREDGVVYCQRILVPLVEKDLGLDTIVEAAQGLALNDSSEDGDLTIVVNPSGVVDHEK